MKCNLGTEVFQTHYFWFTFSSIFRHKFISKESHYTCTINTPFSQLYINSNKN